MATGALEKSAVIIKISIDSAPAVTSTEYISCPGTPDESNLDMLTPGHTAGNDPVGQAESK